MSQGVSCKCPEGKRPISERRWVVLQRNSRCSAFDGYRQMFSDYSAVQCHICGTVWRTKADFVLKLPNGKNLYDLPEDQRPKADDIAGKYAMVPTGEYTVPLIGVPPSATQEVCAHCHEKRHMSEITLDDKGHPICATCKDK